MRALPDGPCKLCVADMCERLALYNKGRKARKQKPITLEEFLKIRRRLEAWQG